MINTGRLNNTKKTKSNYLFFNRVPKVGSQSLMNLMKDLGKINDYIITRDKFLGRENVLLSDSSQLECINEILECPLNTVYSKHTAFIDFNKWNYDSPIYINLVRDPIERIISWYYYIRAPWYFVGMKMYNDDLPLPDPDWLRKDFVDCILDVNDGECKYIPGNFEGVDHRRQTLFFCGQNKSLCMPFNSYDAMQKAKENVENVYAVVGTFEETNITLTVLEHYIPKYFKGVKELYWSNQKVYINKNKNTFKPTVPEEIKDMLRKNMTNEIEFYEFCKQRLYKQYLAIIKENTTESNEIYF